MENGKGLWRESEEYYKEKILIDLTLLF